MLPILIQFKILETSSTGIFSPCMLHFMVTVLSKVTSEKFIRLIIADAVLC